MKVAVIGSPGSGKTWFARKLADQCKLPLYSLDSHYFGENWQEPDTNTWLATHAGLIERPRWIIEGNNIATLESRIAASDLAVLLDLPPWQCCMRIIRRWLAHRSEPRPGLPRGCKERIDLPFLLRAWRYREDFLPSCLKACEANLPHNRVLIVQRKSDLSETIRMIAEICRSQ